MAPHAEPGEVYLLAGDGYNNDKRRITYKDGVRFSTVHKDSEKKHTVYARHAPEIVAPDDDDDGPRTVEEAREQLERPTSEEDATETDGAPDAEPEPDTSEPATPASVDGPEDLGSGPSAEADGDLPDDLATFIERVESAPLWADVKKAMRDFFPTETFRDMATDRQNKVRASTWEACVERKAKGEMKDLPDHGQDVTAFRLWLEWIGDPDAINGTLYALQRGDQWKAAPEATKKALSDAVRARLGVLT